MTREAITPADLLGRIEALNVVCSKCERRGRYRAGQEIESDEDAGDDAGDLAVRQAKVFRKLVLKELKKGVYMLVHGILSLCVLEASS
jgi:hypothetical protein